MIFTIAARELRSLFLSPLAWTILAVLQFVMAYLFLIQIDLFVAVQTQLAAVQGAPGLTSLVASPLFDTAGFMLLMVVPVLTMRLLAEEQRNQTLSLLFSAPVSISEIVLGKYLGILSFLFLMILMFAAMPLSLSVGANLDYGLLGAGLLGLLLLAAAMAALGLFMSSLTSQPLVAAVASFGTLMLLWILDWASGAGKAGEVSGLFAWLSLREHFATLLKGEFNSADVIYYLLFILTFLVLSVRRLDSYRLQH